MEAWIPLAVLGLLAIPFLIVILLIVYIAKTNKLSRNTAALEGDIAALKAELARLAGSSKTTIEYGGAAGPEFPRPPQQQPSASESSIDRSSLLPRQPGPEPLPPAIPTIAAPSKLEPEVYVSPFRHQGTEGPAEQLQRPSRFAADSQISEAGQSPSAPAPGSAPQFSSTSYRESAAPPARTSRTRAEWESLIGGRLLNWIGALAIIIGIGSFLGYGYQNNWISPELLVSIGAVIGLALLAGGDLSFRKGYRIFCQGLIGAGISILYLAVYASFNYFHLESQATAFLIMCSVTILTFVQAFRFDSLSVSLLGWAGGFLTPALVSTGQANEVALFTYISILDAGLLAIVAFKDNWVVLQPLTLAATCSTYILWYEKFYDSPDLSTTAVFLTIFWALFHALDVGQIVRYPNKRLGFREPVAILNAAFYYVALSAIVDETRHDYLSTVTLGLGAAYLLTVAAVRTHPPRVTEARLALTGAVLLVIATAIQFSGFDTVFCWSMEALALVLASVYWKEPGVLWGALILYLTAVIKLIATPGWYSFGSPESFLLLINRRALAFVGLSAAGAAGALIIRRAGSSKEKAAGHFFDSAWSLLILVLIGLEIQDEFGHLARGQADHEWLQFVSYLAIAVVWMAYALLLLWYGSQHERPAISNIGLFAAGASLCTLALAGVSYRPITDFSLILNVRSGAFATELICLLVLLRWSAERGRWPSWAHGTVLVLFCLLIFVLCTAETRDYFDKILDRVQAAYTVDSQSAQLDQTLTKYANLQQVALSLVWLIYSILLIGYGIWRRILSLRIIAIIIFGVAILKIFIYDLRFLESLYRIFSFIGLGLILLSVSFLYQRFKSSIFESGPQAQAES
jgi:uncharacterized membrane protein